jgi:hypothetical protein
LEGKHFAVVALVVHSGQVERAVHDGLAEVHGVLGADHDVAELARPGRGAVAVHRERQHVGGLVDLAMLAIELADPLGVDELDRDVAVLDAG